MKIKNILIAPDDGRFRGGWRIAFMLVFQIAFTFVLTIPVFLLGLLPEALDTAEAIMVSQLLAFIGVFLAIYVSRRALDRRPLQDLGLDRMDIWKDLAVGFGIGGLIIAFIFMVFFLSGTLVMEGFVWDSQPLAEWGVHTLILLVAFVFTGLSEELQFRGYILQNLEEGLGLIWAVALSSLLFAALHLGNPDGFALGPLIGIFLAGIFFAFTYYRTRSLWLVTGLHIGWNFFENPIFGFPVSGLDLPGLFLHSIGGQEWFTGGGFGPEAGFVLFPALIFGALLVAGYTKGRA